MTKVTIKHVAKQAGLSIATVSRVINNHPDVSGETRLHVLRVIEELGYEPNAVARSLIQGRSNVLGVVSTGIEFYGPSQTMAGIERQANESGYWLMSSLLPDPETDAGEEAMRHLLSQQVEGIIWAVPEVGKNREWICEQSQDLPVRWYFFTWTAGAMCLLWPSIITPARALATGYLLAQGRRQIGCISGPLHWWEAQERQRGWRETLIDAGIPVPDRLHRVGDWTAASGMEAFCSLVEQNTALDAVFVSNDQMALGVLKAAHQLGWRVPEDLAVVGFDDIPEAAYFIPSLTTMRHDLKGVGIQAVSLLERILNAHRTGERLDAELLVITPELMVRESSRLA